jgi:hypothetical protein
MHFFSRGAQFASGYVYLLADTLCDYLHPKFGWVLRVMMSLWKLPIVYMLDRAQG